VLIQQVNQPNREKQAAEQHHLVIKENLLSSLNHKTQPCKKNPSFLLFHNFHSRGYNFHYNIY
jgi:hypothetical protein